MRIDGIFTPQNLNVSNLTDLLSRLNVGDVVRAQILEITSGEVFLKLFDGTTFKAETMSEVAAKQGDLLDFVVKNKSDKQVFLETVKNSNVKGMDAEAATKKELENIQVPQNSKNLIIAKEFKENNIPLTKDTFAKIADTLIKFSELTPSKALFLMANDIIPSKKNITALNQLVDENLKVGNELEVLMHDLIKLDDGQTLETIQKALSAYENKAKMPKEPQNQLSMAKNPVGSNEMLKETKTIAEKVQTGMGKQLVSEAQNSTVPTIKESEFPQGEEVALKTSKINPPVKTMVDVTQVEEQTEAIFLSNPKESPDETRGMELQTKRFSTVRTEKENPTLYSQGEEIILKTDKEADIDRDKPIQAIRKAFGEVYYKISSDKTNEDINPAKVYKELLDKLDIFKDTVQASIHPEKEGILTRIEDLSNNLKFHMDLSKHNFYVQIPIQLPQQNTTGELYILRRDEKRKKIDAENATLFISLATEYLGHVDSLVSFNKKNISIHLRVENDDVLGFVKEYHKELYERLAEKGFKLVDFKSRMLEDKVTPLNVKEKVRKELKKTRAPIDYRI